MTMKRIVWILLALLIVPALVLLFIGPRMKVQPRIRAFQEAAPLPPKGVVPVDGLVRAPTAAEAKALTNPLAATATNLLRGKVYYGYYCQFCHGATGSGDGPVGQSYVPAPALLKSARVQSLSDGELLRAMLTGPGHEPALERVVPPAHRWFIVLYLRDLAKSKDGG